MHSRADSFEYYSTSVMATTERDLASCVGGVRISHLPVGVKACHMHCKQSMKAHVAKMSSSQMLVIDSAMYILVKILSIITEVCIRNYHQ